VNSLRNPLQVVPNELYSVIEDHVAGLAPGDGQFYWNCPDCYAGGQWIDSAGAATDDLIERVIEPLEAAQHLVDQYPKLSRMTSSLDASEMTVDPVFVLNDDMSDTRVSNRHVARMVYECGNGRHRDRSARRFELADGRSIDLPSNDWISGHDTTDFKYIAQHGLADQNAEVIEQTGSNGQPEVLADFSDDLAQLAIAANRELGCGCDSTTAAGGSAGLFGVLLALVGRRRQR